MALRQTFQLTLTPGQQAQGIAHIEGRLDEVSSTREGFTLNRFYNGNVLERLDVDVDDSVPKEIEDGFMRALVNLAARVDSGVHTLYDVSPAAVALPAARGNLDSLKYSV